MKLFNFSSVCQTKYETFTNCYFVKNRKMSTKQRQQKQQQQTKLHTKQQQPFKTIKDKIAYN